VEQIESEYESEEDENDYILKALEKANNGSSKIDMELECFFCSKMGFANQDTLMNHMVKEHGYDQAYNDHTGLAELTGIKQSSNMKMKMNANQQNV
jgi:hypothetical protein